MFKKTMLITIIAFFIILSVLVIVHELGHFLTAKYFGVQVSEFGIGFPPRAKTLYVSKDGVHWTLNWLPIGGFVKLKGEDGAHADEPDSFAHKAPWKRVVILSAGVVMNMILAFILLTIGFAVGWPEDLGDKKIESRFIRERQVLVSYVEKNTPASASDLRRGDIIKKVNGISILEITELQELLSKKENQPITFTVERLKETITKTITPENITFSITDENKNIKRIEKVGIGVSLREIGVVRYPLHLAFVLGVKNTFVYTGKIFAAFGNLIKDLVVRRTVSSEIGGPVMIATLSGQVTRLGIIYIIQFLALLSLNLAIINILPIPALDGGRVLFVLIEKFKGKAISLTVESWVHMIGFWLLILLTILITMRDIGRFHVWEKIKDIISL